MSVSTCVHGIPWDKSCFPCDRYVPAPSRAYKCPHCGADVVEQLAKLSNENIVDAFKQAISRKTKGDWDKILEVLKSASAGWSP